MKVRKYSGRCNILISLTGLAVLVMWLAPTLVSAEEAGQQALLGSLESESVHSVAPTILAAEAALDSNIFTAISPITTTEGAVRLPDDQRLDKLLSTTAPQTNGYTTRRE